MTFARRGSASPATVSDLMRREVIAISPDASLQELARLLHRHRVSGVPVVEEGDRVVGIVSVTDILWLGDRLLLLLDEGEVSTYRTETSDLPTTVREIMTPDVFGLEPTASLRELLEFFSRTGLHRVPVVEERKLLGIVTASDLLELLAGPDSEGPSG